MSNTETINVRYTRRNKLGVVTLDGHDWPVTKTSPVGIMLACSASVTMTDRGGCTETWANA